MVRATALVVAAALLPNGCAGIIAKAMGKGGDAPASSATSTSATAAKPAASSAEAPTATTPPVWTPPAPPAPKASPKDEEESEDLEKARGLMKGHDYKKVRALLEKKAHAHDASTEEAKVLIEACTALKDKRCVKDVKTRYREDLAR